MADLGEAKGKIVIDADTSGLKRGAAGMDTFGRQASQAGGKVKRDLGPALSGIATTAAIAGAALAAAFGLAIKAASDFEFRLSAIQAVSGGTEEAMAAISEKALQIGRDTAYGAGDAAGAMEDLAKAGLSLDDIMNGAADATVALAAAGEVELSDAATIASNAMNQFGLTAEDMANVANKISGAANSSAINVNNFGKSLTQVGAVANLAGASFDDTAVAIALMGNAGIKGGDAGTSLKSMFLRLNPESAKAKDLMKELGLITADGANQFYDAEGSMKSMSEVSQVLQDSLAGMTKQQQQATLTTLFGSDAIRGAAVLAENGAAGFDKMAASVGSVDAGEVAAGRLDNLSGSITIMKGSLETAAITLGMNFTPAIKELVDKATLAINMFGSLDKSTQKQIGLWVAGGAGAALLTAAIAKMALSAMKMRTNILLASGAQTVFGKTGAIMTSVTKSMAVAQKIYNSAMNANPILRVVTIVLALIAVLITLAGGWDEVKASFEPVMAQLEDAMTQLQPVIKELLDVFMELVTGIVAELLPIIMELAQQLFPLIMDVILALVPIISQLVTVMADILGPVLQLVAILLAALAPVISLLLAALTPLINLLLMVLVPVINAVVWVLDKLTQGIGWVIDKVKAFFTSTDEATSGASSAWESFMAIVQPVIDWFTDVVWPAIKSVIDWIVDAFQVWLESVTGAWNAVWDVIKSFLTWWDENVAPLIQAVVDLVVAIFNLWWAVVSAVWNAVWDLIESFVEWFQRNVQPPISRVVNLVIGVFKTMRNFVTGVFSAIWSKIKEVVGWVVDRITTSWNTLTGIVSGIFTTVQDKIEEPLQKALDFIGTIKDKVVDAFRNAGTWLKDAGAKIINGLKEGIENTIGRVKDTLTDLTDKIVGWKGPPKRDALLLEQNGELIMKGLMSGIQSQVGNLHGLLGGMNVSIPAALNGSMLGGGVGGGSTDARQFNFDYKAAPGSAQISGEDELMRAMRRARVTVPGWAA